MSRTLKVKKGTGETTEIVLAEGETYDDLTNKLLQRYPLEHNKSFRFICKGKVVTPANFSTIETGAVLLALECVKPNNTSEQNIISNTTSNNTPNTTVPPKTTEQMYTYDQVKATMVVFLDFIRSNPQIRDMYENDYPQLVTEIISNPIIEKVLREIMTQSTQILNAMKNGKNISINIGEEGDYNEISMTPEDGLVIDDLIKMGFDPNKAVVAYLKNKKDKAKTVEALLNGTV